MKKRAIITGVTGQDGSYLSELLLEKGYEVHGLKRRSSLFNTQRIDHLFHDTHEAGRPFFLHYADLTDSSSIVRVIKQIEPDEIYNLGAQSHVKVSFPTSAGRQPTWSLWQWVITRRSTWARSDPRIRWIWS